MTSCRRNVWKRGFENVCVSHEVTASSSMHPPSSVGATVVSIVDHQMQEAVCAALLLKELLRGAFPPLSCVGHVLGAR